MTAFAENGKRPFL